MPSTHSALGPSSAARWLHCTPSVKLTADLPDTPSPYTAEGTLAHAVAELKLRKKFFTGIGPKKYNTKLERLKATQLLDLDGNPRDPKDYWPEIMRYTDDYVAYIAESYMAYKHDPYIAVEVKVRYQQYAPGGFGTADCILIGGDKLHIIDFKYGKGVPVSAEHNPQIMLYALGAIIKYDALYSIKNVEMTIFQPRAAGETVKTWSSTAAALTDWADKIVKPAAKMAQAGEGPLQPGEWCRFCRLRPTCRACAKQATALEDFAGLNAPSKTASGKFPEPARLTNDEIGQLLVRCKPIRAWIDCLDDYALSALLRGEQIPGWKAVEGRSRRAFDDQGQAFDALKTAGVEETMLYERRPLTLSAIEKMIGKTKFAEIAGTHIVQQPGKPTLAPESDNRPPITSAAEDFKNLKTERKN